MAFLYSLIFYGVITGLLMIAKQRQANRMERATRRYYELQVALARRRRRF